MRRREPWSNQLQRRLHDDRGYGALPYIVVSGSLSILAVQPSLIVAAVDRLSAAVDLFITRIQYVF